LGIDVSKIQYRPRSIQKGTILRFLIAATFREKKGVTYALEALSQYREINDGFEVSIIGGATAEHELEEEKRILQTLDRTGLRSKVRFLGWLTHEQMLQEAYRHHVFLSPSVTSNDGDCEGGAPVAIIEMAASGMPIISTKHCDIPYVLSEESHI